MITNNNSKSDHHRSPGKAASEIISVYLQHYAGHINTTVPEINITTENRPSQKEIYLPTVDFQGLC